MNASTSLRLRLLAIASLSLAACSEDAGPDGSAGSAGSTAGTGTVAGSGGSSGQGGAGQGGAGQGGAGVGGAGQGGGGAGQGGGGAGQGGAGAGQGGAGTSGSSGQTGAGQSGGGQGGSGGAADKCEALHPDVGHGGQGGGSTGLPETTERCYQPSAEEQAAGCLPSSDPKLLEVGYLSSPWTGCGYHALSVHSEAVLTEGKCCYETCSTVVCPGRPLVVEQGVRLARLLRAGDWG